MRENRIRSVAEAEAGTDFAMVPAQLKRLRKIEWRAKRSEEHPCGA